MKTKEELKEEIVRLKLDIAKLSIPKGRCPYTYYNIECASSHAGCDKSCTGCETEFLKQMEFIFRQELLDV